jgi:hypothetical protein
MTAIVTVRIQEVDFDVAREIAALTKGRTDIGAVVSFSGICRGSDNGESVAALTLEHHHSPRRPHHAGREHRAGRHRLEPPTGGVPRRGVPDGLPEDQRAILET